MVYWILFISQHANMFYWLVGWLVNVGCQRLIKQTFPPPPPPSCFQQTVSSDQGWSDILQTVGVSGDGEGVSFDGFWGLVNSLATTQHGLLSLDKVSKCNCIVL